MQILYYFTSFVQTKEDDVRDELLKIKKQQALEYLSELNKNLLKENNC